MATHITNDPARKAEADEAKRDARQAYDSLRTDVADLASSVKKLAGAELGGAMESAQDTAQRTIGQMERSIRENPTQAALVAAGVGFVVGLVLTR